MFRLILLAIFFVSVKGDQRIAGGEPADISAYPFSAALLTNHGSDGDYVQACGGTILTSTAILSAASCFHTNELLNNVLWWRARVGSASASSGGSVHLINRITVHPDFSPATLAPDLAVLRPTVPFYLQPGLVAAARIAGASYNLTNQQPIWAIGWGAISSTSSNSDQLREVQLFVVNSTTCANRYQPLNFTVTDSMVCTGWLDVGVRGQCQGDSGSPLVINGVAVGVHSWAEGCADGQFPGINTMIASFTRWIVSAALVP